MYNAFKQKRDDKDQLEWETSKKRSLKEVNPAKFKRRMDRLSEKSRLRRDEWIEMIQYEDEHYNGNSFIHLLIFGCSHLQYNREALGFCSAEF